MIYLLLILLISIMSIVFKDMKNKFNYSLAICLVGVTTIMISLLLKLSIDISGYEFANIPIYKPDYYLYLQIRKVIKITITLPTIICNIGISIYLIGLYFVSRQFVVYRQNSLKRFTHLILNLVFIVLYNIFYHPKFGYLLYIKYQLSEIPQKEIIDNILLIVNSGFKLALFIIMFLPFIKFYQYFKMSKTSKIKFQVSYIGAFLGLLNLFLYYSICIGPLNVKVTSLIHTGFWSSMDSSYIKTGIEYTTMPILTIVSMTIVFVVLSKYNKNSYFHMLKEKSINKKMKTVNKNMRDVLHTHKNTLFAIKVSTHNVLQAETQEKKDELLNKLVDLVDYDIGVVSNTLDNLRNMKEQHQTADVLKSINQALKQINPPENIKIKLDYNSSQFICNIANCYLSRVFVNIINNAIESIQLSNNKNGKIIISVCDEHEYIYVTVNDNGLGISKKNINKIFHSYFTTKFKQKNWGLGLSYVYNVINTYYGYVWATSDKESGTSINLLLNRG